jgi:Ca-activated chloride channel family protein
MLMLLGYSSGSWAQTTQSDNPGTVMVLDVSGSMWGQIEGRSKIEIAREVIAGLMTNWNPSTELGLVAYGHRREGDCTDIETVIPVGPVDANQFVSTVNALVPRGKTPLTEAVRQAAETLRYQDAPATVILVSDGIESCNADPCALAQELEKAGVGFTAHVVGFDVAKVEDRAQLRCIAENTGGQFVLASTAAELATAMETVSVQPVVVSVSPPPEAEANTPVTVPWEGPDNPGDYLALAKPGAADGEYLSYVRTAKGNPSSLQTPEEPGTYEVRYVDAKDVAVLASAEIVLVVAVELDAPPAAPAGSEVAVTWSGPDNKNDFITVVPSDTEEGQYENYAYTRKGSPAVVRIPDVEGAYEIRYLSGKSRRTLASLPISATGVEVLLDAPPNAAAGSEVSVPWTGPDNKNDFITVVPSGTAEGQYKNYAYTRKGSPAKIRMPDEAGGYELRYLAGQSRATLVSLPITVTEVAASLEAAPTAAAGFELSIAWTGPDNKNDYIAVVPLNAEEGKYLKYQYTRKGSPVKVQMPDEPGQYELRYVSGQSRATLVSAPITVTAVTASLVAPPSATAGAEIAITWSGPDNKNDYIAVVPPDAEEGKHLKYQYTRKGSPAKLQMPDEAGQYELRYVLGQSQATLTTLPITVTEVSATLEAPPSVLIDTPFQIEWTGPDNNNDYIAIALDGSPDNKQVSYTYTRKGSPAKLKAPKEAGQYELRYFMGQSRRVLARVPIVVN